jgi:hypothetical protein
MDQVPMIKNDAACVGSESINNSGTLIFIFFNPNLQYASSLPAL